MKQRAIRCPARADASQPSASAGYIDSASGEFLPTRNGQTILDFLSIHDGADVILTRNLAMKRFKIDEDVFNYWLGQWRFQR